MRLWLDISREELGWHCNLRCALELTTCVSRSRYHTGSLAFGSLIIAIVQMIRATLEYIEHKLKGKRTIILRSERVVGLCAKDAEAQW